MSPAKRAGYMWKLVGQSPNLMVPWYLMTSWLYYHNDISLLPDEDYDRLCKKLLEGLHGIEHWHKHLVDEDALKAGTGYAIASYPGITTSAAFRLAIEDKHVKWNKRRRVWEKLH
ncbi:hypothetical protein LZK73_21915 [Neorhizobium galegae]|nr:hypothetical protein LZK73_21915 [Neorhizobium galegae]